MCLSPFTVCQGFLLFADWDSKGRDARNGRWCIPQIRYQRLGKDRFQEQRARREQSSSTTWDQPQDSYHWNWCWGKNLPWINPTAWLRYIINHGLLYMLSGLRFYERHLVGRTWQEFWTKYQGLNPAFDLFNSGHFDPTTPIGLFVHGDEGRTLKRNGLMVTTLQSILGQGFDRKRLKRPRDDMKLHVNFKGHTFITRFLVSALPKSEYQANPEVFHHTMDKLAEEMKKMLDCGIRDSSSGVTYKFCILGVKGDMPYLQKVGRLKRSWNTTVKRGVQRKEPPGVCHLCLAGTTWENRYPCEDTSHKPSWLATVGVKVPWDTMPRFLRTLPHDKDHPGSFFKPDLWHCIHLGVGKSFIASTLQLALTSVPANNNDDRFEWLTQHYITWCRGMKTSSHVSKISAYLVSYNDATGATGNWSKGSLTSNLMRWLVCLLHDLEPDREGLLVRCREAARDLNATLSFLYNAPLFLEKDESIFVYNKGMAFFAVIHTPCRRDVPKRSMAFVSLVSQNPRGSSHLASDLRRCPDPWLLD